VSSTIASIVGARPEFVQVGALTRALAASKDRHGLEHHLIHTGQHYDYAMSTQLFKDLGLPEPAAHLDVGSRGAASQVGAMLSGLEPALEALSPDMVLVFGDTNSTLAGALAGAKLGIPVAHVESGLRSYNRSMPEEINRVVTDHLAQLLFCPSPNAVANLAREGISDGVHITGDVMYESLLYVAPDESAVRRTLGKHGVDEGQYVMATVHRAENTDDRHRLNQILLGLGDVASTGTRVLFPVHPRTASRMDPHLVESGVRLIDPVSHPEMIALVSRAALLMTDSGGLQKEAYWLETPCVTMRDETEWVETVENGWNVLAGADRRRIALAAREMMSGRPDHRAPLYGEGTSPTQNILELLAAENGAASAEAS
jgi:UDP-N-acetylglucosamine 2-epimerase